MKKKSNLHNHDISLGAEHLWLPYCQMLNHAPQLNVKTAKGTKIFLEDGRILIDGISSWWSVAHGYNHPHLIKSICKQAKNLSHIMLAGFANEQTYKLAHRICNFTKMDRVFFSDSGSTAIEVAMKIAWQFHINSNEKQKKYFVSFKNSYHGDTTGAMSLADLTEGMHQKFCDILLKNFSVNLPKNENEINEFEDFIKKNQSVIAGIFIEPIVQCAGGMKFHDAKILEKIFLIAKKFKILFIADECAVGFYRTGKKFAFEHAKIKPDILVIGKALTGGMLTLAATLTSNEIFEKFLGDSLDLALNHGPTFTGNALACASANASLDLFEQENYEKKVANIEVILKKELSGLIRFSKVLSVRVIGAIGVVEITTSWEEIKSLRKEFINYGVFLRPFSNCIYVMPSLNIKNSELKKITKAIYNVLGDMD